MPRFAGIGFEATSNASVMPAGAVHVAELANACAVTIMALATVVVMLGAVCVRLEKSVVEPFSTSIGSATSTPANDWMPPAAPAEALNVQVWFAGSAADATFQ